MTEPNSAFEGLVRDFKAAALNAGARDMEATVNPAYDSANVQLHYDLMNAAEKALLDAYAGVVAERDALKLALEIAQTEVYKDELLAAAKAAVEYEKSDATWAKAELAAAKADKLELFRVIESCEDRIRQRDEVIRKASGFK